MRKIINVNKNQYIAVLLLLGLFLIFGGCANANATDDDIITLLDPYEEREDIFSATSDVYNKTLSQFKNEHPEIIFTRKVIRNEDYYGNINSYATMQKGLSDVFVIPTSRISDWIEKGEICSEPEYIYPLSNKNMTIIVYDKKALKAAGFDLFPNNWEDALSAMDTGIAMCEMNGGSLRSTYLTPYTYMCCSDTWIDSLKDKQLETTPFLDDEFVTSLKLTKKLCDLALTKDDLKISDRALVRFLNGDVIAAVITTDEMYELKEKMLKEAPERYENLGFSFLPANIENDYKGSKTSAEYMTTTGVSTVLVINSKLKENPEKLKKCDEFCKYMTGQTFADNMAEMFGFECENKSDKSYNGDDVVWSDMLKLISNERKSGNLIECENLGFILEPCMIGSVDNLLWQWVLKNDYSVEEIANYIQDYYEE